MAKLSVFLPPLAGDYSGAAGVLFGLNSVNVIVDASCCTHNYTGYDEPRWNKRRKTTFGAQLRTLEATLGDDMRLLDQVEAAVAASDAQAVVLIGTPVPALVGMDLDGLAWELEDRCGLPAFGIATTGFDTYDTGASMAQELLVKHFAKRGLGEGTGDTAAGAGEGGEGAAAESGAAASGATEGGASDGLSVPAASKRRLVNVLGATVHDFGSASAMRAVHEAVLTEAGVAAGSSVAARAQAARESTSTAPAAPAAHAAPAAPAWSTAADYTLRDVARAGSADESVVVGWSGLAAARFLSERFGIPYRVGVPSAALAILPGVRNLLETPLAVINSSSSLLIVHDQVIGCSIRVALRNRGVCAPIVVASLFGMDADLMEDGDFRIAREADLIGFAKEREGLRIAGDPLLRRLPTVGDALRWELPHEAVSSTLYADLAGKGILA